MKILFVCRANIGRSQMAKAIYNKLTVSSDADSAGTDVLVPGETILEHIHDYPRAYLVLEAMHDIDPDLGKNKSTQMTKEMLDDYDKIIVMAEPQFIPKWLSDSNKYEYWNIPDPMGESLEKTIQTRDMISQKVNGLIAK